MLENNIIEVKQLPVIVEQLQTIKADVTERVNTALSLVCTEETVKTVKQARAALTKEFKEWEVKRGEVKKAVMSPYEQFEAVYKDCITDVFKKADADLKSKIDSVENELKAKKAAEVKDYFYEYAESKGFEIGFDGTAFFTFEQAGINVTLSASLKSLKEQAKAFIDRICDDMDLIATQEHKDEILYHYRKVDGGCFLNVSRAIQLVNEKYKAIEEEKVREAERQKREQAAQAVESKVEKIAPPIVEPAITAPTVEEADPVLKLTFTVTAPKSKLRELKAFLENGGYDYE